MPPKSKRRKHRYNDDFDNTESNSKRLTRAERMAQDPLRNNRGGDNRYQVGKSAGARSLFPIHRHYIYGTHPVMACLLNTKRNNDVLFGTKDAIARLQNRLQEKTQIQGKSLENCVNTVMVVDKHALNDSVPDGAVHQGLILLTAPLPRPSLDEMVLAWQRHDTDTHTTCAVAVLDQVTDPHNVGAILRSASVFGLSAVILPDHHAPPETAVLAKSASGALELVPLVSAVNLIQAMTKLKQAGFWTVGFAGETEQNLHETNLSGQIALIIGAEGTGMRRLTRENCDFTCKIPMVGLSQTEDRASVDSLNVSNAAAIAFYEWSKTTL